MQRMTKTAALAVALAATGLLGMAAPAAAKDLKIALITSKTGPLEAYAKQTETGFMMGLEYMTRGSMTWDGRKIQVILKDDQLKPDLGKSLLEQAYSDDDVDLAVGRSEEHTSELPSLMRISYAVFRLQNKITNTH